MLFFRVARKKKQKRTATMAFRRRYRPGGRREERRQKGRKGRVFERQGGEERSCKAKVIAESNKLQSIIKER